MKVQLKGVKDNDAVIVIECACGNKRMLNEADNLIREEIYINRFGTREKRLRCAQPESLILKKLREGKTQCHEHYRVTLYPEVEPPFIEVAHLSHRREEKVLAKIQFPPQKVGGPHLMYPPDPHPYVSNPYEKAGARSASQRAEGTAAS